MRTRRVALVVHFRDFRRYRTFDGKWVKMGKLYRSDGLDKLTDADLATVQALGIKLICDLRTNTERAKGPDREVAGAANEQIDITGQDQLTQTLTAAVTSGDPAEQRLFDASFNEVKTKYGTFARYLTKGLGVDAAAQKKLQQELLAG